MSCPIFLQPKRHKKWRTESRETVNKKARERYWRNKNITFIAAYSPEMAISTALFANQTVRVTSKDWKLAERLFLDMIKDSLDFSPLVFDDCDPPGLMSDLDLFPLKEK